MDGPCTGLLRAWSSSKGDADAAATPIGFLRLAPPGSTAAKGGGGAGGGGGSLRRLATDDARRQEAIGMWAVAGGWCAARLVYSRRASAGDSLPSGTTAVAIDRLCFLAAAPGRLVRFCQVAKLQPDTCGSLPLTCGPPKGNSWTAAASPWLVDVEQGWNRVDDTAHQRLVHVRVGRSATSSEASKQATAASTVRPN